MSAAQDKLDRIQVLKKLYVKFEHYPTKPVNEPAKFSNTVIFTKQPEIWLEQTVRHGQVWGRERGFDLIFDGISTHEAGAVVVALQVTGDIAWGFGFTNTLGKFVTELHVLRFSIPILKSIPMPGIALRMRMHILPRVFAYIHIIKEEVNKLEEMTTLYGEIARYLRNRSSDFFIFHTFLKGLESKLRQRLGLFIFQLETEAGLSHNMQVGPARFPGTRIV